VRAELLLGEEQGGARGGRDDQARIGRSAADHVVVGDRAHAAFHVGHGDRLGYELGVLQRQAQELAGQIEAAAGLGRRQALELVRCRLGGTDHRHGERNR